MNCTQTQNLLDAHLDGELDLVRHLEIEHHLQDCRACADAWQSRQALRNVLAAGSLYYRAPTGLADRVRSALNVPAEPVVPQPTLPARHWGRAILGMAAALAFIGLGLGFLHLAGRGGDDPLLAEVVASHARSLLGNQVHLLDVASADPHTVKPWFAGKVDFAPAVFYVSNATFTLAGGRLDYLDGRPVAALVYRCRGHVINLFVWPGQRAGDRSLRTLEKQGFHLISWTQSGMNYWAISDLNPVELTEFARDIQAHEAGR